MVALLLVCFAPLRALDPDIRLSQYLIASWTDEEGLPQNTVKAMLQTRDGYLWVGTEEGLARFDGVRFHVFDTGNTPVMNNHYILSLYEDRDGNLWIGTRGEGLLVYSQGRFKHFGKKEGFDAGVVYALCQDRSGTVWIGTDGKGLFKFKNNQFTAYTQKDGLPSNIIRGLAVDSLNTLWIGTETGFSSFHDNRFQHYSFKDPTLNNRVKIIYEDGDKVLWVGSDKGLFLLVNGTPVPVALLPEGPPIRIYSIFEDRNKNLWVGTASHGLFRALPVTQKNGVGSRRQFQHISKTDGLNDNTIVAILEDREGGLWLGTAYGGINCLRNSTFSTIGVKEGLADDIVFALMEDTRGALWVGTNNGLNCVKDNRILTFTTKDGLSNNVIDALYEDGEGYIWVGTDDGLNRLQLTGTGIRKVGEYARNNYILAISGDKKGNLWLGTLRGLAKLKDKTLTWYNEKNGLPSNTVIFIHEDRRQNLWIGTYRAGLTLLKDDGFTSYTTDHGLADNSIGCLHEDGDGVLWVGTTNGLSRFKDGVFRSVSKKNGLFNDNIYKILEDGAGKLWMSSNRGVFSVSKQRLDEFFDGKVPRIVSASYGTADGMRSNECNGGYQSAGCKSAAGGLWFPTVKGAVNTDPAKIRINDVPPPVHIESVKLDNVPAAASQHLTIPYTVKRVEVDFTALSFIDPAKTAFKYKLEGYEGNWLDGGNQRVAYYTNLDAGDYRFRVIACNNDGVWNETGAEIRVTVIPAFYNTVWFRALALIGFALFSYLVIHFVRKYISLIAFWRKQRIVANFKLAEKLGSGGMGTIYKAQNLRDKTDIVALKVLREELLPDENHRKRFKQEAVIIDQLDHPNIVKVFERGQSGHNMYIAMELLVGRTLTEKIKAEGHLEIKEALRIMMQIASALQKIHGKNIVHRDLKPDNVMLITRDGDPNFVKLLDFGLARMEHQTRLTQTGMVVGTIKYLAPEQISGSTATIATDVYSVGIVFYEMLTGKVPYMGESTMEIMRRIMKDAPEPPHMLRPEIPMPLSNLIMKMIAKHYQLRPEISMVRDSLKAVYASL